MLILLALLLLDILLTAALAGLFYAFSVAVMRGLDAARPASAVDAMTAINAKILNPFFAPVFFGPLALGVAIVLAFLSEIGSAAGLLAIVGVSAYAAGVLGVTFAVHLPLNARLASRAAAAMPDAADDLWRAYSVRWTRWNHVRAAAALLSLACLVIAIRLGP